MLMIMTPIKSTQLMMHLYKIVKKKRTKNLPRTQACSQKYF